MSFILDALRKSDAERQRSTTPGLADLRYRPRRSRRDFWIPVLVVVLALNGLILGIRWLGPSAPPAATPTASVAAPNAGVEAAPAAGLVVPAYPEVRPLAQEADVVGERFREPPAPEPNVVVEMAETGPAAAPAPVPVPPPAFNPAPGLAADSSQPGKPSRILPGDDLPTAAELIATGRLASPMLNLDLHVYSGTPESRFVVINSRRYKEGATLEEGPVVRSITPDGVILEHQGNRFILPRK